VLDGAPLLSTGPRQGLVRNHRSQPLEIPPQPVHRHPGAPSFPQARLASLLTHSHSSFLSNL
jgi:hypothetical protein